MAAPSDDPRLEPYADADSTFDASEAATDTPDAPMRNPAKTRLHRKDIKDLIDMATKYATTYKHLLDSPYLEDFVKLQVKLDKPLTALYGDARSADEPRFHLHIHIHIHTSGDYRVIGHYSPL
jgi:hypothetical protein